MNKCNMDGAGMPVVKHRLDRGTHGQGALITFADSAVGYDSESLQLLSSGRELDTLWPAFSDDSLKTKHFECRKPCKLILSIVSQIWNHS